MNESEFFFFWEFFFFLVYCSFFAKSFAFCVVTRMYYHNTLLCFAVQHFESSFFFFECPVETPTEMVQHPFVLLFITRVPNVPNRWIERYLHAHLPGTPSLLILCTAVCRQSLYTKKKKKKQEGEKENVRYE